MNQIKFHLFLAADVKYNDQIVFYLEKEIFISKNDENKKIT